MKRLLLIVCALMASVYFFGGSCDEIKGPERRNQAPEVQFVNIPVEGAKVSSIITLHWHGTDVDGFIRYFRYCVVRKDSVNAVGTPAQYLASISEVDMDWTEIEVTPSNPATSADINMAADGTDPVRNYLSSYVFLQAIDNLGARSAIVFKHFQKNNHFPNTKISINSLENPYVNVDTNIEMNIILREKLGVEISWDAVDSADYLDPPPFQFKWKLFGPYTDAEMAHINDKYTGRIFQDLYGDFYFEDDNYPINDSTSIPISQLSGPYGSWENILYIDTVQDSIAPLVTTHLPIPLELIRVVDSSGALGESPWGYSMGRRFRNVFDNSPFPTDTTSQYNFLFWCQARDDAEVPDKVPAFGWISIIEPKFEREVIIIDHTYYRKYTSNSSYNWARYPWSPFFDYKTPAEMEEPVVKNIYGRMINEWAGSNVFDMTVLEDKFITKPDGSVCQIYYSRALASQDYYPIGTMHINSSKFMRGCTSADEVVSLREILKHKIIILIKDNVGDIIRVTGGPDDYPEMHSVISGLNAGMSCLSMTRDPFHPNFFYDLEGNQDLLGPTWRVYFGVDMAWHTGWSGFINDITIPGGRGARIEDFVGAEPISKFKLSFPALPIDISLLENNYLWTDICDRFNPDNLSSQCRTVATWQAFPYRCYLNDEILAGALPEVGYISKMPGEFVSAIYSYKARNGTLKTYDEDSLTFTCLLPVGNHRVYDGATVAVYTNAQPLFKTAHFAFTFVAVDQDSAQVAFSSIMDSLADGQYFRPGNGGSGKMSAFNLNGGNSKVNVDELRRITLELNAVREQQIRDPWPLVSEE